MRDRALVERAQDGDLDAFTELYTRYFRRLVRFSAKRIGDVHEAEEIAQEAFVRAYRALPTFAGERRFYPWITVIASRLCVDALRRRGRVEVGEIHDRAFLESGFDRLDSEGDLLTLHAAMGRLTGRHREVLELREQRGWSYQHIADHYDVSLGTVEALLWRARKALRREFTALCSSIAAIPVLRRFIYSADSARPAAFGAIGAMGTVMALSVGMTLPQPAPAVDASPAAILSVSQAGVSSALPTVAPPSPGAPASSSLTDGPTAGPRATTGPGATPTAAPAPQAGVLPGARILSSRQAASEAQNQPIVISVGPASAIGLNPGVPLPPVKINLGRHP
jgi:RNA polymerase sigma-70 factor (ECF subfamily)